MKSGYVPANGVDYDYEIRGTGEPLLLLHGGLGSTGIFQPIMPRLTEHRQVLVYGDSDMFRPEHEVQFYQLLGGGLRDAGWMREHMSQNRLAILPDQTHYDIFFSPRLVDATLPFLDGVKGSKTWDEQLEAKK